MSIRRLDAVWMVAAVVAVAVVTLVPVPAAGQEGAAWSPPRTADGQPDLQGVWANNNVTPLERPERHAGRERLTADEVAAVNADARSSAGDLARRAVWWGAWIVGRAHRHDRGPS